MKDKLKELLSLFIRSLILFSFYIPSSFLSFVSSSSPPPSSSSSPTSPTSPTSPSSPSSPPSSPSSPPSSSGRRRRGKRGGRRGRGGKGGRGRAPKPLTAEQQAIISLLSSLFVWAERVGVPKWARLVEALPFSQFGKNWEFGRPFFIEGTEDEGRKKGSGERKPHSLLKEGRLAAAPTARRDDRTLLWLVIVRQGGSVRVVVLGERPPNWRELARTFSYGGRGEVWAVEVLRKGSQTRAFSEWAEEVGLDDRAASYWEEVIKK